MAIGSLQAEHLTDLNWAGGSREGGVQLVEQSRVDTGAGDDLATPVSADDGVGVGVCGGRSWEGAVGDDTEVLADGDGAIVTDGRVESSQLSRRDAV